VDALEVVTGQETIVGESTHGKKRCGVAVTHRFVSSGISDFWTTGCQRCPEALDRLDAMASDPMYHAIKFVSICCDRMDGARSLIDKEVEPRWQNVNHFFVDGEGREKAKQMLGFRSVPFYVVVDERGVVRDSGGPETFDIGEALLWRAGARFLGGDVVGPATRDGARLELRNRQTEMWMRPLVLDDDF